MKNHKSKVIAAVAVVIFGIGFSYWTAIPPKALGTGERGAIAPVTHIGNGVYQFDRCDATDVGKTMVDFIGRNPALRVTVFIRGPVCNDTFFITEPR